MARTRKRASSPPPPASTAPEEAVSQRDKEQASNVASADASGARRLQFNQEITWRPGKPIVVSELLRRLESLSTELRTFEQGEGNHPSLRNKAKELVSTQLLDHKDNGVKAWTFLCITQVFSIMVPGLPYPEKQLQHIFTLFTKEILPALADTASPYLQQYMDALTLLVQDESIVLILGLPNSEQMVSNLFKKTFDIMAGKTATDTLPKNVEYKLVGLLSNIIQEAESLDNETIEIILAQFLHAVPASLGADPESAKHQRYPVAYNVARSVCNVSVARMTRYVSDYFSSVLIDASEHAENTHAGKAHQKKRHDGHNEDGDRSTTQLLSADDLGDAKKAHTLLRELWRSSDDLVQGIIPQIEAELSAENQVLRTMAVEVVGDMIAGIGAAGPPPHTPLDPAGPESQITDATNSKWSGLFKPSSPHAFASAYPTCYQAFLDRRRDKAAGVRAAWTTAVGHIISTNAGGKGLSADELADLARYFVDLLRDHDEKVRLAAVQAVSLLEFAPLVQLLQQNIDSNTTFSDALSERIQDPRQSIRKVTIDLLGRAWGAASHAIHHGESSLHQALGQVPTQILEAFYKNHAELNELIVSALYDLLLPLNYPPTKAASKSIPDSQRPARGSSGPTQDPDLLRARRILVLVHSLTERGSKVFFMLQKRQPSLAKYLSCVLDLCDELNASVEADEEDQLNKKLDAYIELLVKHFPQPVVAKGHLRQLVHQDKRNRHLVRFCIATESEYSKVVKAIKELRRNVEKRPESAKGILETLEPLLRVSSILIYNRSHVLGYTHFARTDEDGLAKAADLIVQGISAEVPAVLKIHISELCKDLQRSQPSANQPGADASTANSLKACANFARRFPGDMTKDRAFYQAMNAYALYGSPKAAKHAVSIILLAADKKEMHISNLTKECIKGFKYGAPHFLARLSTLAQLRLLANEQTESYADEITKIASADVLCNTSIKSASSQPVWSRTDALDDGITAKLLALKVLVNGLRGKATSNLSTDGLHALRAVARPPYQLMNGLIEGQGELSKDSSTPQHHKAHLRLAAGLLLLKLSRNRVFDSFLSHSDFNRLSRLCQDERPEVRLDFAKALRKNLSAGILPTRFTALVFLYAHDPVVTIKQGIETWVRSRLAQKDAKINSILENAFPRLLSLLAHHQFFDKSVELLEELAQHITFYLRNIATLDNLPIIYSLAQRCKTVKDGINVDKSDDLYLISDLAEAIIRAFQEEKGWILQIPDIKPRLPAGLFKPLPQGTDAQALAEQRFLPDEIVDMIPDIVKADLRSKRRKTDQKSHKSGGSVKIKTEKKRTSDVSRRGSKRSAAVDDSDSDEPDYKKSKVRSGDDEVRRRSSRNNVSAKSYAEPDSEDDNEADGRNHRRMAVEENKENLDQTSSPDEHMEDVTANLNKTQPRSGKLKPAAVSSSPARKQGGRRSARTSARHVDEVMS